MDTYTYPMPDPLLSDSEARRYNHQDLMALSDFELWQEQKRLEHVLAWGPIEPDEWLKTRYERVVAEQARRKGGK